MAETQQKPSAPSAPKVDIAALIAKQLDAQKQLFGLSLIDQFSPYGSAIYAKGPGGRYSLTQTLSPELQTLFGQDVYGNTARNALVNSILDQLVNSNYKYGIDNSLLPKAPSLAPTSELYKDELTDKIFQRAVQKLNPEFNKQWDQLGQQLAQQGITPGSTKYRQAMEDFTKGKQQTFQDAFLNATERGAQEQSRLFNLETLARQNALNEQSFLRDQPIKEMNTLLSGNRQFPGLPQGGQVAIPNGPDYLNAGLSQAALQQKHDQFQQDFNFTQQKYQDLMMNNSKPPSFWSDALGQFGSSLINAAGNQFGNWAANNWDKVPSWFGY